MRFRASMRKGKLALADAGPSTVERPGGEWVRY
jgi:hypothetical protein